MFLVSVFVNTNVAQIHLAATAVQLLQVAVVRAGFEALALELDQIVGESELREGTRLVTFRRAQTGVLFSAIGTQKLPASIARCLSTENTPENAINANKLCVEHV